MEIRQIDSELITRAVYELYMTIGFTLPRDVKAAFSRMHSSEKDESGKLMLGLLIENCNIAEQEKTPICQDTGMAVVFLEIGQNVHISGKTPGEAVNEGVRRAYQDGYLRKSIVNCPFKRENTDDNTPAVVHTEIVSGDKIEITAMMKGFGSENMSAIKMFDPGADISDVADFAVSSVMKSGSRSCPPVVVGIGVGGTLEVACLLAKRALALDLDAKNPDENLKSLELEVFARLCDLNIGPNGMGGESTVMGVRALSYPTHIAGLPVAISIGCHAHRHGKATI